jgi:hypothetical protein
MEATCFSETSADFQWTTRRYIPEDRGLHNQRCENLKSCIIMPFVLIKAWLVVLNDEHKKAKAIPVTGP